VRDYIANLSGADKQIDLRYLGEEFFSIALSQTTGNDKLKLAGAFLFFFRERQYFFESFLLGGIDKSARIDNDYVGCIAALNQLQAGLIAQAAHDLGIN
jgi:hypothetical protein